MQMDEDLLVELVRLELRRVPDNSLLQAFSISGEELEKIRKTMAYRQAVSAATLEEELNDADADDDWGSLERRAVRELNDQMDSNLVTDTRTVLAIAKTANTALKRAPTRSERDNKTVEPINASVTPTVIVNLRPDFFKSINKPAGHSQLLERQVIIDENNQGDVEDATTIEDMREHAEKELGISMDDIQTGGTFGANQDLADLYPPDDFNNLEGTNNE